MSHLGIRIAWPDLDLAVRCHALPDAGPILSSLLPTLPVEVVQSHAVISGEAMYMLNVPLKQPLVYPKPLRRESLAHGPCGRFWTSSVGCVGQFTIKYGKVTEDMAYPSIGQVLDEDIPAVIAAGRAVWDSLYRTKRILRVRLSAL